MCELKLCHQIHADREMHCIHLDTKSDMLACTLEHSRSVQTMLNTEIYFKAPPAPFSTCACSFIESKKSEAHPPSVSIPLLQSFYLCLSELPAKVSPTQMSRGALMFWDEPISRGGRAVVNLGRSGWRVKQGSR